MGDVHEWGHEEIDLVEEASIDAHKRKAASKSSVKVQKSR